MSNEDMSTKSFLEFSFGKAIHGLACGLSLTLALVVLVVAIHAITLRVSSVENIRAWCGQTGACTELPEYFGKNNLSVFVDKAGEAQEVVNRFSRSPLSSLLTSTAPSVTAVLRAGKSRSASSNGRSIKEMSTR